MPYFLLGLLPRKWSEFRVYTIAFFRKNSFCNRQTVECWCSDVTLLIICKVDVKLATC